MRKYIAAVLACLSLCALMLPALADSSAPVAENFEFETYRGVSFGGRLAAVDPEGDAVSFEITTQPKRAASSSATTAASSIPPSTASAAATTSAIRPSTPTATARRRRRS